MKTKTFVTALSFAVLALCACKKQSEMKIDYEKYTLSNGLEVVLHEDHSDPMTAVAIQYHVGSNREVPGKTGYAHLFEHMLFQASEHLGRNVFFNKIEELGGDFNGGTWQDGTIYYESVPKDALEKILWMESDRMGFFINTVSETGLRREQDVVINEKRQTTDNNPYGFMSEVVNKNLYPEGHPYSWTVIGEMADLKAAHVDDIKDFYFRYYCPNNATLVVAGDFDVAQTKEWIQKYFGEIPARAEVEPLAKQYPVLETTKKLFHEDQFAELPNLRIVYPSVDMSNEDAPALEALSSLLSGNKKAPLYKSVVLDKKLAPNVVAGNSAGEISGTFIITARAYAGTNLNDLYAAIEEGFAKFEEDGVDETALQGLKNSYTTSTYANLSSVLDKAMTMAENNVFFGSPDHFLTDLADFNAVTAEDVMRVYNKYIKGQNKLIVSFVPQGQADLVVEGSERAHVTIEDVTKQDFEADGIVVEDEKFEFTPSAFDRSVEPDLHGEINIPSPEVWTRDLAQGVKLYGVTSTEIPLVYFNLTIEGGHLFDKPGKSGVAQMTARMMNEGSQMRTPEEMEEAINNLGAALAFVAGTETVQARGYVLKDKFDELMALMSEQLLSPRWDETEFERIKQNTLATISMNDVQASSIAQNVALKVLYGDDILGEPAIGTIESVSSITLDDLKEYYSNYIVPNLAKMNVVGDILPEQAQASMDKVLGQWSHEPVQAPVCQPNPQKYDSRIFFVDLPGASQSYEYVARPAMSMSSPDYNPARVINFCLGEGTSSRFFNTLRLQKGYTYGAYARYNSNKYLNLYYMYSNIQGSVTKEAVDVIREIFTTYGETFSEADLKATKDAMVRSKAGAFESYSSLLAYLQNISAYGLDSDYAKKDAEFAANLTLDQAKELIAKHIDESLMQYIIVGDAKYNLSRLSSCGLGKPILLDKQGNQIK